jgi:hypothetical protein
MPTHRSANEKRSPFLIIPEFISPLMCEEIVDEIDFNGFALDPSTNRPLKTIFNNRRCDVVIANALELAYPLIENHFGAEVGGYESISYEWFPEGCVVAPAAIDGYTLAGRRWMRSGVEDLILVVFMSEFNNKPPFDTDFEVFGGKLEFPSFGFGFKPQMGTAIVFPSAPNFVHGSSGTRLGDLFQIRVRLTTVNPYRYDATKFTAEMPG